jgi:hypothetical protein
MKLRVRDRPQPRTRSSAVALRAAALAAALLVCALPARAQPAPSVLARLAVAHGRWAEADPLPGPGATQSLMLRGLGVRTPSWRPFLDPHVVLPRPRVWTEPLADRLASPINLDIYQQARLERAPWWQTFMLGRYGARTWRDSGPSLAAPALAPGSAQFSLGWSDWLAREAGDNPGASAAWDLPELTPTDSVPDCRLPRVTLVRNNGERDRFSLVDCAGAVTADAVDRVSVMARPYGTQRPPLPLPASPDPAAAATGEWLAGVKLVHPRLVWALNQIAQRFPRRPIHIVSGYRPANRHSNHAKGRALDLRVLGVNNEALFAFCRKLPDTGCGYYPNSTFVHVDVRPLSAGHAFWVDISGPGETAQYVDSWPGVVTRGARIWDKQRPALE